ncbi:MAG TPA: IS30 family transposase [Candidatus Paceibacterota bacterium]|nr:IS30 family transposase [Candidatus Paceibacterota bacterium]
MGKSFNQLSYEERVLIGSLHKAGSSVRSIAAMLNRSPNTISRELREKKVKGRYVVKKAQHKTYVRRYLSKRDCMKVALDSELSRFVKEKLEEGWSPERIAGYLKMQGQTVSTKAIYKYVYSRCLERYLFWRKHHVRGGPKRRHAKTPADGRKYIEKRPALQGSGHFEGDFIVSSHNTVSLLVVVDRYSRKTLIRRLPNRKHATVSHAFVDMLREVKVKTLTLDNDVSFNHWRTLQKLLHTKIYFCHPYHSWEKGLVENTNRWIRTVVEKRRDIATVTHGELRSVEHMLNEVPRQCLGFHTAVEVELLATKCPN